jgi:hypothetical protein
MAGAKRSSLLPDCASKGIPEDRMAHLRAIKARIVSGFYNTEPVLDDLSHAFTKAVQVLI